MSFNLKAICCRFTTGFRKFYFSCRDHKPKKVGKHWSNPIVEPKSAPQNIRFLRRHCTQEGHVFTLFGQTDKQATPAWGRTVGESLQ